MTAIGEILEPIDPIEPVQPEQDRGRSGTGWWAEHRRLRRFLLKPSVILSFAWLLLVIVSAIFAPLVAPEDPNAQNLLQPSAGVSVGHLLGTDDLGRDVLSRLIWGSRISMAVTFETVGLALVIALIVGLVAGFRGGWVDYLLMRGADAGMAFPPLILALAVVAVLGPSIINLSIALAIVFSPGFARFIRGQTLAIERGVLCRSVDLDRLTAGANHDRADPPERPHRAGGRDRHRAGRSPVGRIGAELLGPRAAATGCQLGFDVARGLRHLALHPSVVPFPRRSRYRPHRARFQHVG